MYTAGVMENGKKIDADEEKHRLFEYIRLFADLTTENIQNG